MTNGATMTMPFDVCERFIDKIVRIFPTVTREQARECVVTVDEVIEERIRNSDLATKKDIFDLEQKMFSMILWMTGIIVTIIGIAVTIILWKMK